jgi:hypothetical protein
MFALGTGNADRPFCVAIDDRAGRWLPLSPFDVLPTDSADQVFQRHLRCFNGIAAVSMN